LRPAVVRFACWSKPKFREILRKSVSVLSAAKCAKYCLFSDKYHTILRQWSFFCDITREKSGFTKNRAVPACFCKTRSFLVNFVQNMARYGLFETIFWLGPIRLLMCVAGT
jgi:hypothetical protein